MPFAILVSIFTFLLLCTTCGYGAYWVTGGHVDLEIWRSLAVMWGIDAPFIGVVGVMIYADAV